MQRVTEIRCFEVVNEVEFNFIVLDFGQIPIYLYLLQYFLQISNHFRMQFSKEKSFQRTNPHISKKVPIFNIQILQQLARKSHFRPTHLSNTRPRLMNKQVQISKQLSKNKQQNMSKQQRVPCNKKDKKNASKQLAKNTDMLLQQITASETYKTLQRQYLQLKNKQVSETNEMKKSISQLNKDLKKTHQKGKDLQKMRNELIEDMNALSRVFNDLRLRNYDLQCELYARRGYLQSPYYESVPDIDESEDIQYEEWLELQQRLGSVEVGYPLSVIEKMPVHHFDKELGEEKCCICCMEFEKGDDIFTTACTHVHHHLCLQKWLQIKRVCPLCRQEIVLT